MSVRVVVNGSALSSSSPTFTGTVTADVITTTGNATFGNAAGDTFKVHGTSGAGTQASNVAAVSTTGATNVTPFGFTTAAQPDALVAAVNSILTCLKTHGLMASS